MAGIEKSPNLIQTVADLEFPGGPIPLDSRFYINRSPAEARACAEIGKPGSLIRIKAPRKMGKSSLMLRIINAAVDRGYRTVTVDFQQADEAVFATLDKFLRWLCVNVARQLKLEPNLDEFWDEDMGSKVSCSLYFENYLLEQIDSPLVLVLNEVNRVFERAKIAQEFLPLLRFWYEQARQSETWEKLRIVVIHSTEIYIALSLNQSPFNVGLPIKLSQFTTEQVEDLARRHGLNWSDSYPIEQLMQMVGGHPYLVHLALYHLAILQENRLSVAEHESGEELGRAELEQLLKTAPTQSGIYSDYLRNQSIAIQQNPELAAAFQQVLDTKNSIHLEPLMAYQLDSMGLVKLEGNNCSLSCELYRLYFQDQNLCEDSFSAVGWEELQQENERLLALVNVDELTQIGNRRHFDSCLRAEWKHNARDGSPISLILCDIDYFKIYNDTYGHQAGDSCLRSVAQAIRRALQRPADVAARYGGEEFAVILPQTDAAGALLVAEHIRTKVKAVNIVFNPESVDCLPNSVVTISLGIASVVPGPENDAATLVLAADEALYDSKRHGRDRLTMSTLLNFRFAAVN
ncbi:AAA-like domain-containing protein [Lyngbya sp. CCAP 1446/10]|uniref:AAA-like domain-containing protein n=1 Tax=Microcoleaceae TaxID=1892252 RepID=UPI00223857C8|nr:AAA-like domain-containing protein [Lyngbya sp. CCAP 1446/10]MCW6051286.1 AAA-like domain-containing protein [Lyngbya sp. CCAP 1446/10]